MTWSDFGILGCGMGLMICISGLRALMDEERDDAAFGHVLSIIADICVLGIVFIYKFGV